MFALQHLGGVNSAQTSAGTNQATAQTVVGDHVYLPTVGAGTGVILQPLPAAAWGSVTNADANNLLVYPPVGASFNGYTTNSAATIPPYSSMIYTFLTPLIVAVVFS